MTNPSVHFGSKSHRLSLLTFKDHGDGSSSHLKSKSVWGLVETSSNITNFSKVNDPGRNKIVVDSWSAFVMEFEQCGPE